MTTLQDADLELDKGLIEFPIVDFLAYDRDPIDTLVVAFVPDPRIYNGGRGEQLESVIIDPATLVGRHVLQLLDRLGEVLNLAAPPVKVGHGGGDDFVMYDAQGNATQLPAACDTRPEVAVQAYAILQVLGQEAQLEFLDERRRGLVAAAG